MTPVCQFVRNLEIDKSSPQRINVGRLRKLRKMFRGKCKREKALVVCWARRMWALSTEHCTLGWMRHKQICNWINLIQGSAAVHCRIIFHLNLCSHLPSLHHLESCLLTHFIFIMLWLWGGADTGERGLSVQRACLCEPELCCVDACSCLFLLQQLKLRRDEG